MIKYINSGVQWIIPCLDYRKKPRSLGIKFNDVVIGTLFLDTEYYRSIQNHLLKTL